MPNNLHTEVVHYTAGGRDLASYLAYDPAKSGKRPGLIVLPEWWGLNDYLRRRARELAGLGFVAMATDVYGEGREAADSAEAGQLMGGLFQDIPALGERLRAAYETLKQHPEARQEGVAVPRLGILPIDKDAPAVGLDQPQHAFQRHRLVRARPPDDDHRGALGHMKRHAAQHALGSEGFVDVLKADHTEKNTPVSRKFAARISTAAASTDPLVARPTPCAPRPEFIP